MSNERCRASDPGPSILGIIFVFLWAWVFLGSGCQPKRVSFLTVEGDTLQFDVKAPFVLPLPFIHEHKP